MADRFRFRPRFGGLAWGAAAFGAVAAGLGGWRGSTFLIVGGAIGVVLGLLYLRSPAWRFVVSVDDDGLEVSRDGERRFLLPWAEVREVVASPATSTCFVDGGSPARSLLVPGDGAPAPYDVERKGELVRAITERVARLDPGRVREVASLDAPPPAPPAPPAPPTTSTSTTPAR